MKIVGSTALVSALGPVRRPVDVDIIGTPDDLNNFLKKHQVKYESERKETEKGCYVKAITPSGLMIVELEDCTKNPVTNEIHKLMTYERSEICSLEWLYFLKMSHRFKANSAHFMKTMTDIHMIQPHIFEDYTEKYKELFQAREKETYKKPLPKLNQGKDTFFKKEETYNRYDHDHLHTFVALGAKPAYMNFLKEGAEVMTDKEKFF